MNRKALWPLVVLLAIVTGLLHWEVQITIQRDEKIMQESRELSKQIMSKASNRSKPCCGKPTDVIPVEPEKK